MYQAYSFWGGTMDGAPRTHPAGALLGVIAGIVTTLCLSLAPGVIKAAEDTVLYLQVSYRAVALQECCKLLDHWCR